MLGVIQKPHEAEGHMITKVGLQGQFSDALKELLELEYETVESYDVAISKIDKHSYKDKLLEFAGDHLRHIQEISEVLDAHDEDMPNGPGAKQWLTKGKVAIASLIGDSSIITAVHSNELDTNKAYERLHSRGDAWEDAKDLVARALKDQKRHTKWLEQR